MFKLVVVIFAVIACVAAKPGLIGAALAYTAPASYVTATSSQFVARNHNGIVSAPVVAPAAYTGPVVAAYSAPVVAKYAAAYSSPLAYSAPVVAKYAAAYSAPLSYAAAPLAYANAPLDAAYASSRVDIKQNYNAYALPATYAAVPAVAEAAPVATPLAAAQPVAPIKYTAAPVLL